MAKEVHGIHNFATAQKRSSQHVYLISYHPVTLNGSGIKYRCDKLEWGSSIVTERDNLLSYATLHKRIASADCESFGLVIYIMCTFTLYCNWNFVM